MAEVISLRRRAEGRVIEKSTVTEGPDVGYLNAVGAPCGQRRQRSAERTAGLNERRPKNEATVVDGSVVVECHRTDRSCGKDARRIVPLRQGCGVSRKKRFTIGALRG
jgi:hypothetical protein